MASVLEKDPDTYAKERDGFLRDLQHFHEVRGTPFTRIPKLNGHEVDLFLLYSLVTEQGGWIKVNYRNSWSELFRDLNIPENCVNASIALKQIYLRYLDRWEKVHFLGEEADRGSDDDEESRHKRWSARSLHSVPLTYNYQQHNIPEAAREFKYLSTELYKPSDYDRLALSLLSPLPNEQDFAINVCTLLSNDGKHTLKLEKNPRLLDYLLAHAGVFNDGSLRKVIADSYITIRKQNIGGFWKDTLETDEFLDLTDENLFIGAAVPNPDIVQIVDLTNVPLSSTTEIVEKSAIEVSDSDSDDLFAPDDEDDCVINNDPKDRFKLRCKRERSDRELFNLRRNVGTRDYMGQRVLQIATILRNLSFFDENVPVLVHNSTFVRFALLCSCSRWNQLMNLGMEMLGNMATEFLVKDLNHKVTSSLLRVVSKGLQTEDRNWCITALEVLNKLSQNEANEDSLLRNLEACVYEKVCSFLTIHDVMLLIYTLECLYSLSSLGERACNCIVNTYGVVDTLVSLVTVEGKSYGPKACIGMRLVETVTGSAPVPQQQSAAANNTATATPVVSVNSTVATPSAPTATPVHTTSSLTPVKTTPSTPQRPVQMAPQRLLAPSPQSTNVTQSTTSLVSSPQLQQKHAHQQTIQENEQFALNWLRNTYEPSANGKVEHQELYKHYINSCGKLGRRGVIAPLHFPRCVRSVFGGTVGPNPEKPSSPSEQQYYEGIKVMAHPHLSQALLGSGCATSQTAANAAGNKEQSQSNTSLIKSLLATKVNECMTPVSMRTDCQNVAQVAARQRLLAQQNQQQPAAETKPPPKPEPQKNIRLNGARQLFTDNDLADPVVSSTTQGINASVKSRREPPQPPPPLAPLSNNKVKPKVENEDSDSTGNSLASSTGLGTIGISGVSSTEDGDNSLTSFEGLLNGIPSIDNPMAINEDSNSKDSVRNSMSAKKPLMLADLLEKKVDKDPPTLNGVLGKELRIGGLELVENHIDKVLGKDSNENTKVNNSVVEVKEEDVPEEKSLKRPASDEIVDTEAKRPHLATNGNASAADSPAPDSVSSSNGEEGPVTASTAAAKLFADLAADILEDEEEEMEQEQQQQPQPEEVVQASPVQQVFVDNNQQVLMAQPRQIIVSQSPSNQVVIPAGAQIKTQGGQAVIVQNSSQPRAQMVQSNMGQILLSQGLQGQMQLVPSGQPGQYVIQTGGPQGYVMAQPQTAMVHGQQQTVLVAQTTQNQGAGTKTIIILQQNPNTPTHHQKVVVTPQGQQMVVTQVQRPILQQSTVGNITPTTTVVKTSPSSVITQTVSASNGVLEKKEEVKQQPVFKAKPKVVRDLTTPFVCEWGDCQIDVKFKSANQVFMHVCATHIPDTNDELLCQWDRCDSMKRKRFSLMTHINDKHCNLEAMKTSLIKRKQIQQTGKTEPPAPPLPTQHPGYAPDAAFHAIKRHALEFVNPKELQDDNEGPVTKSIRLTASLILRNLVIYSSNCRRYLKHYEPHLANVALSNVESSRTIAQVLYDMNDCTNHR